MSEAIMWYAPLTITLIFAGFCLWRFYQAYIGLMRYSFEDISAQSMPPPPITLLVVNQLTELGFQRLGEMQFRWRTIRRKPHNVWIFAHKSSAVIAEVITVSNVHPVVFLMTRFQDNSQIETGFPSGMNVDAASYHAHMITTSLSEACQYHLAQIEAWQTKHGSPEKTDDMNSMLQMTKMQRDIFNKHKLKVIWQIYVPILLVGIAVPIGWFGATLATLAGAPSIVSGLIAVGIPLGPILWIYLRLRSQQQSRPADSITAAK